MAGRGPVPKPSGRRVGHARARPAVVVECESAAQPKLPGRMPDGTAWPARTRAWWRLWRDSPLAESFTAIDWSELLDTAVLHAAFWRGEMKVAAELRQRVAKFGATPEDRARLRIQFASADTAESKSADAAPPSFEHLRVVLPPESG